MDASLASFKAVKAINLGKLRPVGQQHNPGGWYVMTGEDTGKIWETKTRKNRRIWEHLSWIITMSWFNHRLYRFPTLESAKQNPIIIPQSEQGSLRFESKQCILRGTEPYHTLFDPSNMDNSMSPAAWRESFVSSSKAQNIRNEQDVATFVRLFGFLPARTLKCMSDCIKYLLHSWCVYKKQQRILWLNRQRFCNLTMSSWWFQHFQPK